MRRKIIAFYQSDPNVKLECRHRVDMPAGGAAIGDTLECPDCTMGALPARGERMSIGFTLAGEQVPIPPEMQAAWEGVLAAPRAPGMSLLVSYEVAERNRRIASALDERIRREWSIQRAWERRVVAAKGSSAARVLGEEFVVRFSAGNARRSRMILKELFAIRRAGR